MNIVNWDKNGLEEVKDNNNIIIKIDDSLISVHSISLPNINSFQAKKTIPFSLEDKLLDDIDNLEFFFKKQDDNFDVWVIAKDILLAIKDTIKKNKLKIIGAYPNFMFLPESNDGISYIETDNNISFRLNSTIGGTLNKEIFFSKFGNENLISINDYSKDYNLINLINLDIKEFFDKNIKPWFGVLILAFIIFTLYFTKTIIDNNNLEKKIINIQTTNQKTFKQIFPEITKIVDIKKQTEQKLKKFNKQKKLNDKDLINALLQENNLNNITNIKFDKTLKIK